MAHTRPKRHALGDKPYSAYSMDVTTMVETHWHSHFLFNLVVSGNGEQEINGERYPLQERSVIILSPMDFHRNVLDEGKSMGICAIKFSEKVFQDTMGSLCGLSDFPIVSTVSEEDYAAAKFLFELLLKEQEKTALGSEVFAKSLIQQLVILALRGGERRKRNERPEVIQQALTYIHYHFRENIRAADVAEHIGYSPNYFSTEFKKQLGVSFQVYLQELRLDFAKKLLKLSDRSVTEVCYLCGFNTPSHFSQMFKKRFGKSPERYKEEHS